MEVIISIWEKQIAAGGRLLPCVTGRPSSLVLLMNNLNAIVLCRKLITETSGIIRRTIIDQNNFQRTVGLRGNCCYTIWKKLLLIMNRNNNADQLFFHKR